jgi:polysaccharide deacetylase family protein (PEP-CTERM system associated)
VRNLLTIDVEEYFQVEGFADVVDRASWDAMESRVRSQTARLLDLLDATRATATFFVLGWTAERHPGLVREIVARGHEVASHGWGHRRADHQGVRAFRRDVRRSKRVLERIVGAPVAGYRAPCFSITPRTPWAHRVLLEERFAYSSSVFPVLHDRYGDPAAPRTPWTACEAGGRTLAELPPLTLRVLGRNLPVAGGGYLRVLPVSVVSSAIGRMNDAGHPAVLYLHPWEVDPEQPRIAGRALNRFRHYAGLASTERKLRALLTSHAFTTVSSHLGLPAQRPGAARAAV